MPDSPVVAVVVVEDAADAATGVFVGAGGIGRAIYQMLTNAGVSAQCAARRRRNDPGLGEIAALAELPGLLPGADFVILVLPLTEATRGVIGPVS